MYAYCDSRRAHRRTGKLLVATDASQLDALRHYLERGATSSVPGMRWLDGAQARALEPALGCAAAVESPESGIVDVPELVMALLADIEAKGGRVQCNTEVASAHPVEGGFRVETAIPARSPAAYWSMPPASAPPDSPRASRNRCPPRPAPALRRRLLLHHPRSRAVPAPHLPAAGIRRARIHLGLDMAGRARFQGPTCAGSSASTTTSTTASASGATSNRSGVGGRRCDPQLLPFVRHPAQAHRSWRCQRRLRAAARGRAWHAGLAIEPVRHRIARADLVPGDRRGRRHATRLTGDAYDRLPWPRVRPGARP